MLKLIQPVSKKDQVVLTIREAILSGAMGPGSQIVESRIAQQLGTGIPLVREALIELEHHGFVQKTPYKGTTVTALGPEAIGQMFQLRGELEALAIIWAKENATERDLEELRALIRKMQHSAAQDDPEQFCEHDLSFHRKLWALSGNSYLAETLERIVVPLFYFSVMKFRRGTQTQLASADMHAQIVDALLSTNATELRAMVKELISHWKDELLQEMSPEED